MPAEAQNVLCHRGRDGSFCLLSARKVSHPVMRGITRRIVSTRDTWSGVAQVEQVAAQSRWAEAIVPTALAFRRGHTPTSFPMRSYRTIRSGASPASLLRRSLHLNRADCGCTRNVEGLFQWCWEFVGEAA